MLSLKDSRESNVSSLNDSNESSPVPSPASGPVPNDSSEPNVSSMEDSSESIPALCQAHSRVVCPDKPVQFICPLEQEPVPQ